MRKPALLIIDLQNDYFPGGAFPLNNTDTTLAAVLHAIDKAKQNGIPIVHIQHIAEPSQGIAAFFNIDTDGVRIHKDVLSAAPDASIVVKHFADSFEKTTLHDILKGLGVNELILCGMMTQNCVTHTALSRRSDEYKKVTVLTDASTTVCEILHQIALHALSTRVDLVSSDNLLI
jgi:nicotinamidase-related amidase